MLAAVFGLCAGCGFGAENTPHDVALQSVPGLRAVVFVVIDTLRADYVGAYGSTLGLTPNLDAVAAEGVVFEQAIASSSWTRSSIASMFTARYPSAIGVLGRDDAIADETITLAEVLKSNGFRTLGISTNSNAGRAYGFAQGFDRFEVPDLRDSYPDDFPVHTAEGVTRKALQFIDEAAGSEPLFLFLHYIDPHDPYLPHPGLLAAAEPAGRFDGSRRQLETVDAMAAPQLTADDTGRIRHLYAGEVKYCDHWIGELLAGLEAREILADSLLVITADHGEGLWDHGLRGHGRDLYEEMIRVPLIVRMPRAAGTATGRRIRLPMSLVDLAPTILSAVGVESPPDFDGDDLSPLLLGGEVEPAARVFSEMDLDRRNFAAVRAGSLKLIRNRGRVRGPEALELYDLAADPGERRPIVSASPDTVARLDRALDGWAAAMATTAAETARVDEEDLDADTLANLRALGYLGGGRDGDAAGGVLAAALDFSSPDHAEDQLVRGFYELERGRRWMAGDAAVELGRTSGETNWWIDGWIDLDLHDREQLIISVQIDNEEPQRRRIGESGFFLLEGGLPESGAGTTRVTIECDHDFVSAAYRPGADTRGLCVIVRSLGLR